MITKEAIDNMERRIGFNGQVVNADTDLVLALIAEWRARQEPVKEPVCRHCNKTKRDHYWVEHSCTLHPVIDPSFPGVEIWTTFEPLSSQ